MKQSQDSIVVLDSGLGGLSIWQEIQNKLPYESTIYIGDNGYAPYSNKTSSYIQRRLEKILAYIKTLHIKLVVLACNTITVAGVDYFRSILPDIPVVGVVPVIKTAAKVTKTNHITVFSTEYTARSEYLTHLINEFSPPPIMVTRTGCTELVEMIENGIIEGKELDTILKKHLQTPNVSTDVVVIGCTHFAYITHAIKKVLGDHVSVLDSSVAVVRHVTRILAAESLLAPASCSHVYMFLTTGDEKHVSSVASNLTKQTIIFKHVDIPLST